MREVPQIRLFGYGSLMNTENLARRVPGLNTDRWAWLRQYQAVFGKAGNTHVYLTLEPADGERAVGVLIDVDPSGFAELTRSEPGYKIVDVTDFVAEFDSAAYAPGEPRVYAFIAPVLRYIPEGIRRIRRSYWNKAVADMDSETRRWWEEHVVIPKGVGFDEDA